MFLSPIVIDCGEAATQAIPVKDAKGQGGGCSASQEEFYQHADQPLRDRDVQNTNDKSRQQTYTKTATPKTFAHGLDCSNLLLTNILRARPNRRTRNHV
jgi:hypothetical protein